VAPSKLKPARHAAGSSGSKSITCTSLILIPFLSFVVAFLRLQHPPRTAHPWALACWQVARQVRPGNYSQSRLCRIAHPQRTGGIGRIERKAFSAINLRAVTSRNSRFSPKSVHPLTDTWKQKRSPVVAEASARFRQEARTGRTRHDGQPPNPEHLDQDRQNVQTKTVRTNADAGQRQQRIARCDHLQAAGVLALVAQRAHQHYARPTVPPDSRCHREPPCHQTHDATKGHQPPRTGPSR